MSKATIVYVVTSGCYSDYGINAIFSTRKAAQAFIAKAKELKESDEDYSIGGVYWAGDDVNIEEWPLNEAGSYSVYRYWSLGMMLDDGSVMEPASDRQEFGRKFDHEVTQFDVPVPFYNNRRIVRVRSTRSAEHALKLASDKRQEWLRKKTEAKP